MPGRAKNLKSKQEMSDAGHGVNSDAEGPLQASPGKAACPLPNSSRAALGCLALPALMGLCSIVLYLLSLWLGTMSWFLVKTGEKPPWEWLKIGGDVMSWLWYLGCFIACRAMLGGRRRPWVYVLTSLCLGWATFLSFGLTWVEIRWPAGSQGGPVQVMPWFGFALVATLLLWFVLDGKNRRYHGLSPNPEPGP